MPTIAKRPYKGDTNVRVEANTAEKLYQLALSEHRTMTREFSWLIEQEWTRQGRDKAPRSLHKSKAARG